MREAAMPKLEWSKRLSVGVEELDDDHKGLIRIINTLREGSEAEAEAKKIDRCLVALVRYAETHFAREERVLRACGYAELPEHHQEHQDFIDRLTGVAREFRSDPEGTSSFIREELQGFLEDWLIKHILIIDMEYKPLVENKAEARQAARSLLGSEIQRIAI
jgi:hemerythrin-like metal-binding protein